MSGLDEGRMSIAAGSILLIMPTLCAHVDCGMHILFDIKAAKLISWDYHGGCIQIQQMEIVFRPDYNSRPNGGHKKIFTAHPFHKRVKFIIIFKSYVFLQIAF